MTNCHCCLSIANNIKYTISTPPAPSTHEYTCSILPPKIYKFPQHLSQIYTVLGAAVTQIITHLYYTYI